MLAMSFQLPFFMTHFFCSHGDHVTPVHGAWGTVYKHPRTAKYDLDRMTVGRQGSNSQTKNKWIKNEAKKWLTITINVAYFYQD